VEQKNATLVRAYLGDRRLDSVTQTIALNVLYDQMWAYYNLFQPVMHLAEKKVIQEPGKPIRVRRKYDQPATGDRWLNLAFNCTPMRDDHELTCGQCGQP